MAETTAASAGGSAFVLPTSSAASPQTGHAVSAKDGQTAPTSLSSESTLRRFLSGSLSGTFTAALLQPFDVIRTTQQSNLSRSAASSSLPLSAASPTAAAVAPAAVGRHLHRPGPIFFARRIVQEQGTLALWKGLDATLVRVFLGAGLYFVTLDKVSKAVQKWSAAASSLTSLTAATTATTATAVTSVTAASTSKEAASSSSSSSFVKSNTAASFFSGAVARTIAATLLSPVAVVKTRMEFAPRGQSGFRNPLDGIFKIARAEGLRGLYSGLAATIVRDAPYSGLYFAAYQYLVQSMDRLTINGNSNGSSSALAGIVGSIPASGKNFLAALAAGACATLVTQPADLIRTQQQIAAVVVVNGNGNDKAPTTTGKDAASAATVRRILREGGGVGALFIGSSARIMKRALSTAVTWTLFEEAMRRGGGGGGGG